MSAIPPVDTPAAFNHSISASTYTTMAEDGGGFSGAPAGPGGAGPGAAAADHHEKHPRRLNTDDLTRQESPMSPRGTTTPNPFSRRQTSLDLDDYFTGPRDIQKHSKWPIFLQMHGSIVPKMIIPLLCVGGWATCIVCVSKFTRVTRESNSNTPCSVTWIG